MKHNMPEPMDYHMIVDSTPYKKWHFEYCDPNDKIVIYTCKTAGQAEDFDALLRLAGYKLACPIEYN